MQNDAPIDLNELRIKIDQMNEKIISGLKTRARFALNSKTFEEEFFDGMTWFEYRMKKEEDLDSEFGRFLYYDQQPFMFSKELLTKAKIETPTNKGLTPFPFDSSKKIISLYREVIGKLCENKEDRGTYGETTKQDVENVLTLNERTTAFGEQVAAYKVSTENEFNKLKNADEIRQKLIKPDREFDVIEKNAKIAEKYGIENIDLIKKFAKQLIEITLDSEVNFILNYNKK